MSEHRYSVIFTGQLREGVSAQRVTSNLVLDVGMRQEKVIKLLRIGRVVLKRCATFQEAQRLAEKFDRAGALCIIEDRFARPEAEQDASVGESTLMRFFSKLIPLSSATVAKSDSSITR